MTAVVIENTLHHIYPPESGAEVTLVTPNPATKETFISSDGYYSRRPVSESLIAVRFFPFSGALFFCCALWMGLATSDASPPPESRPAGTLERHTAFQLQTGANLKQRQVEFLNRIRRADPERRTIERAIFNPQNELALILARGVEMDKIPPLMRSILNPDGA